MPKLVYQASPSYAPGWTDLVPPGPAVAAHRRDQLLMKWRREGRLATIAARKRAKERLAERWPSHQQVPAREGAQATATTFSSEASPQGWIQRQESIYPLVEGKSDPPQFRDQAPGDGENTRSSSGLLGTWKQRDVSEKNQQVSGLNSWQYESMSALAFQLSGLDRRKERFRIAGVLARLDAWSERSDRMCKCCSIWRMVRASRSDPEKSRPIPSLHCRDRICPECRRARAGRIARKILPVIEAVIADSYRPIMITFTQVDRPDEPLDCAMKRFNKSWAKLIRSREWKSRVVGAINFRESTYNSERHSWHVHSHVLVHMRDNFWDRDELIALWGKYSAGAWNVDIKYATPGVEAELAQYGMKAVDLDDDQILEYAIAMKGVRLISSTGEWKGVLSDEEVDIDEPEDDELDISFKELLEMRAAGDVWAAAVLTAVDRWIDVRLFPAPRGPT